MESFGGNKKYLTILNIAVEVIADADIRRLMGHYVSDETIINAFDERTQCTGISLSTRRRMLNCVMLYNAPNFLEMDE